MPTIGITLSAENVAERYVQAVQRHGIDIKLILPGKPGATEVEVAQVDGVDGVERILIPAANPKSALDVLHQLDGFMLSGGPDVDPKEYGAVTDPNANVRSRPERDAFELPMLRGAMDMDMPVLAICRGMQVLNVVAGGKLLQDFPRHRDESGRGKSALHQIWISPGSKLAASIGSGGSVRVNSRHHQGLREAQKAPTLKASAYSMDDQIIEGLESPDHTWVVGVQFHPEIKEELPKHFAGLFDALVHFAGKRASARAILR